MPAQPLFDPPKKTCQSAPGSILASKNNFFIVKSVLRQGAIGQLVKCSRIRDSKPVMIKMIKNHSQHAQAEIRILRRLRQLHPDRSRLVRWYQVFKDRHFTCLLFEPVETNLLDFMNEYDSLGLEIIRPIIQQVAIALHYLKTVNIIHANLKLENVLLVKHKSQPAMVKVFDFSLAHLNSEALQGQCIQPLPYRSPEIILGLCYDAAVDVWSLGCITAALYLGALLYHGKDTYEMMKNIVEIQGQPPDLLLNLGLKTRQFFLRDASSGSWRLKSHNEYLQKRDCPLKDNGTRVVSSLQDFLTLRPLASHSPTGKVVEMISIDLFVALLKGMLHLDAAQRLTPHQVLQHPFITLPDPFSMAPPSANVTSIPRMMKTSKQPASSYPSSRRPSSRRRTTIRSQFRPVKWGPKERGNFRGASQLAAWLDNQQRIATAALWTFSSSHESKVEPTAISQEPKTDPQ